VKQPVAERVRAEAGNDAACHPDNVKEREEQSAPHFGKDAEADE
jgi:hypothetical protein